MGLAAAIRAALPIDAAAVGDHPVPGTTLSREARLRAPPLARGFNSSCTESACADAQSVCSTVRGVHSPRVRAAGLRGARILSGADEQALATRIRLASRVLCSNT